MRVFLPAMTAFFYTSLLLVSGCAHPGSNAVPLTNLSAAYGITLVDGNTVSCSIDFYQSSPSEPTFDIGPNDLIICNNEVIGTGGGSSFSGLVPYLFNQNVQIFWVRDGLSVLVVDSPPTGVWNQVPVVSTSAALTYK